MHRCIRHNPGQGTQGLQKCSLGLNIGEMRPATALTARKIQPTSAGDGDGLRVQFDGIPRASKPSMVQSLSGLAFISVRDV